MDHLIIYWKKYMVIAILLVILGTLTGCKSGVNSPPTETRAASIALPTETVVKPDPTKADNAPLTEAMLMNATYQGIYTETVQLSNGKYTGKPSVVGAASQPTLTFTAPYALGDLSGDGVADAAVVLVENSGGSGSFVYLAAVLNQAGKPANIATILLGDRIQVQTMTIAEGQIIVKLMQQGPNDPMCCPTQEVENTYELEGNVLALIASKILS